MNSKKQTRFFGKTIDLNKKKFQNFNDYAVSQLKKENIKFESKFNNSYLIVQGLRGSIDFYPGTGAFSCKATGSRGKGIENLIRYAKTGVPPF
jgi:hypothetical protein